MYRFGEGNDVLLIMAAEAETAAVELLRAADRAERAVAVARGSLATVVWDSPEAEDARARADDRERRVATLATELRTAAADLRRFALERRAGAEGRP